MDTSFQLNPEGLEEILESMSVTMGLLPAARGLSLTIPSQVRDDGLAFLFPTGQNLGQRAFREIPHARVALTPALMENLRLRGMYSSNDDRRAARNYFLELRDNGRVFVKYQSILGGWLIGTLTAEQMDALKLRFGLAVKTALEAKDNA